MTSFSRSRTVTALLLAPAGTFFFFLLILPLAVVAIYSFGARAAEGGYAPAFTFDNYLNLPARGKAFLNTLTLAPFGTLLTALFAYPMAYFLAVKVPPKWRVTLLVLHGRRRVRVHLATGSTAAHHRGTATAVHHGR